jgi:hypothetical protein
MEVIRQTVNLGLIALRTLATAWQKGVASPGTSASAGSSLSAVVSPRTSGATLCVKGLAWLRARDATAPALPEPWQRGHHDPGGSPRLTAPP